MSPLGPEWAPMEEVERLVREGEDVVNAVEAEREKRRTAVHYSSQAVLATVLAFTNWADAQPEEVLTPVPASFVSNILRAGRGLKAAEIAMHAA